MKQHDRRARSGSAPKAVDRYLTLLKSGGSDHPMTLLQRAGVDLSQPETGPRGGRPARRAGRRSSKTRSSPQTPQALAWSRDWAGFSRR